MTRLVRIIQSVGIATSLMGLAFLVGAMLPCSSEAEVGARQGSGEDEDWNAMEPFDMTEAIVRARAEEQGLLMPDALAVADGGLEEVLDAMQRLQPRYVRRERDGARLARIITEAAEDHGIEPQLAVAMAMRESSLLPGVRDGDLGERGLFQIMPHSYPMRVCGTGCDVTQPGCNARIAMCYLAHCQEICRGADGEEDVWIYVAAYGMSHCPTAREARAERSTRRARELLVAAVGEERAGAIWPR